MNRRILFVISVTLLWITSSAAATPPGKEIKPTIFVLMREAAPEIDWYGIMDAALSRWKGMSLEERLDHPNLQNVIILDEGEYWAVAFCEFGNGRTATEGFRSFWEIEDYAISGNPNFVVYLEKVSLKMLSRAPGRAVVAIPQTTTSLLPRDSEFFEEARQQLQTPEADAGVKE